MSTFVLVHGAWHGAWAWSTVADILRTRGHVVVAPALAGASDGPPATPSTGLRTHVDAVAQLLRGRSAPVVLVGHSYAGLVVRQAAAAVPGGVAEIILIDGWVGPSGSSLYDLAPPWFATMCDTAAEERGDGWLVPVPPSSMFGVTVPRLDDWLQTRLRPQPRATFTEPAGRVATADEVPGRAVVTTGSAPMPFAALADAAGYPVEEIDSVHDAMLTHPDLVAATLLRAVPSAP